MTSIGDQGQRSSVLSLLLLVSLDRGQAFRSAIPKCLSQQHPPLCAKGERQDGGRRRGLARCPGVVKTRLSPIVLVMEVRRGEKVRLSCEGGGRRGGGEGLVRLEAAEAAAASAEAGRFMILPIQPKFIYRPWRVTRLAIASPAHVRHPKGNSASVANDAHQHILDPSSRDGTEAVPRRVTGLGDGQLGQTSLACDRFRYNPTYNAR